jgi:membrane protease YdiL (CAAX protease family)
MSTVFRENQSHAILSLLLLFALVASGVLAGGICVSIITSLGKVSLSPEGMSNATEAERMVLRLALMANQACSFILPSWVYLRFIPVSPGWERFWKIGLARKMPVVLLSAAFLFAAAPSVLYSYELNKTLLEWAGKVHDGSSMPGTLRAILQMDSPPAFLMNLLLIAVTPAIGEEWIFRGLLQPLFQTLSSSAHLGIWLSAMVFSFFHFQLEGFLPRMMLGLILGYTFHWTRSIWIPMLLHFLNNAFQVGAIYFGKESYSELGLEDLPPVPFYAVSLSLICLYLIGRSLKHYVRKNI